MQISSVIVDSYTYSNYFFPTQLGLSAHDNVTPVRILANSAGHLAGAGRSFAAVLIGNIGMSRDFVHLFNSTQYYL